MPRDVRSSPRRSWTAALAVAAVLALAAGWSAGRYFKGSPAAGGHDTGSAASTTSTLRAARPTAPAGAATPAAVPDRPGTKTAGEPPAILHRVRPDFALPDLDGRLRRPDEWAGSVLVVNFWATWCAPCREEIPLLLALGERRTEVRIVGIALDTADAVRAFVEELDIGYPVLLDEVRGNTMRRYGNRYGALPFTVVVGRDDLVAYTRLGILDPDELDVVVKALL